MARSPRGGCYSSAAAARSARSRSHPQTVTHQPGLKRYLSARLNSRASAARRPPPPRVGPRPGALRSRVELPVYPRGRARQHPCTSRTVGCRPPGPGQCSCTGRQVEPRELLDVAAGRRGTSVAVCASSLAPSQISRGRPVHASAPLLIRLLLFHQPRAPSPTPLARTHPWCRSRSPHWTAAAETVVAPILFARDCACWRMPVRSNVLDRAESRG